MVKTEVGSNDLILRTRMFSYQWDATITPCVIEIIIKVINN
jgi:hypothetical protein